jgi:hypothetical protein
MKISKLLPLAGLLSALLIPSTADAATPGINIAGPPTPDLVNQALGTGAKTVRIFALWKDFEPNTKGEYPSGSPGVSNLVSVYDAGTRALNAAGVKPVFVVSETPPWASGSPDVNVPPANLADYADFMKAFVAHNKAAGLQVKGYEIWNEPDMDVFWHPAADPVKYAAMLKVAYPAIKSADPSAVVVAGPTTGNNYDWYHGLYAAGAGGSFDVASVHTDTGCLVNAPGNYYRDAADGKIARWSFLGYRSVHDEMAANGDAAKPIWMTELGWSSTNGGPTSCQAGLSTGLKASGVTDAQQAQYLTMAYSCLANDPYVTDAQWFTLYDTNNASRDELNHYGLLTVGGAAKPALAAFKAVAATNGGAAAPCGDFAGPTIKVVSPTPDQQFVDKLDVLAGAADAGVGLAASAAAPGEGSLTITYDGGKSIGKFGSARLANGALVGYKPWFGSSALPRGTHTIEFTAADASGNVSTSTITVTKVAKLPSTLTPTFRLKGKKIKCKKRLCTLSGSLARGKVAGPSIGGHVQVSWEFFNAQKKWRRLVGGLAQAHKPFTFKAKIKRAGKWRVRVAYQGQAPWKKVATRYLTFRVR